MKNRRSYRRKFRKMPMPKKGKKSGRSMSFWPKGQGNWRIKSTSGPGRPLTMFWTWILIQVRPMLILVYPILRRIHRMLPACRKQSRLPTKPYKRILLSGFPTTLWGRYMKIPKTTMMQSRSIRRRPGLIRRIICSSIPSEKCVTTPVVTPTLSSPLRAAFT